MIVNEPEIAAHALAVVEKLWGKEFVIVNTELYCYKLLKVNPGYVCSIHCHKKKDETFFGIMGTLRLNIHRADGSVQDVHAIHPGQRYRILPKVWHSFQAVNTSWVAEISTHHDDKDVMRKEESRRLT